MLEASHEPTYLQLFSPSNPPKLSEPSVALRAFLRSTWSSSRLWRP